MSDSIEFVDLRSQRARLGQKLDRALHDVIERASFIMGPEVEDLEQRLAARCDARYAVTCSSGTDALLLALLAWGVGPGDAVLVPAFTFAATAEVVALVGATPVFVDVTTASMTMDHADARRALKDVAASSLRPAGLIAVDLFGLPADYSELMGMATEAGMWVIADAAQSFGATRNGRSVGTFGTATATSFFPSKPLGCYGDGGAVLTDDDALAALLGSLRVHGQGLDKYDNVRVGLNARLDTIQAAVLLQKLQIFDDELSARGAIAARYEEGLADVVSTPKEPAGTTSSWAAYTVRHPMRDAIAESLAAAGIPSAVYYKRPLHRQPAYSGPGMFLRRLPVTEDLAATVLSLPMHPYLAEHQQARIIDTVRQAVEGTVRPS